MAFLSAGLTTRASLKRGIHRETGQKEEGAVSRALVVVLLLGDR
jgi:hypothetical protein